MKILLEQHSNNKIYLYFQGQNKIESNFIEILDMFHYVENLTRVIKDEYQNSKKYRRKINQHILSRDGKNKKEICKSIMDDIMLPTTDVFLSNSPGLIGDIKLIISALYETQEDIKECEGIQGIITIIVIALAMEQLTGENFYMEEFIEGT